MLQVFVGLHGEGRGAGDGEGGRVPEGIVVRSGGGDEGLDGLQGGEGGRRG